MLAAVMSRRKAAVQFSRAGLNADSGGGDGGDGGGGKVSKDCDKKTSLKEGRDLTAFVSVNLSSLEGFFLDFTHQWGGMEESLKFRLLILFAARRTFRS